MISVLINRRARGIASVGPVPLVVHFYIAMITWWLWVMKNLRTIIRRSICPVFPRSLVP